MDRKPKIIFQLDTPFTSAQWPETIQQNQETILELLCSILSPIGLHRSNHVTPSKGKRDKKRKRKEAREENEKSRTSNPPPPPEVSPFIVVGLNSITRRLEALSKKTKPSSVPIGVEKDEASEVNGCHFSAIFVLRSSQTLVIQAHLPQLIRTASLAHPQLPSIRLVQLPQGCDARLCDALGLSRVSIVGILDGAPHAKGLVDLIQRCVPEIESPWLQQVKNPAYLPVKINAIETSMPIAKKNQRAS